jgi:glycosyl transferase family 87
MNGAAGGATDRLRTRLTDWKVIAHALGMVVVVLYIFEFLNRGEWHNDAYGFWMAWNGGLYDIPWLDHWAYVYSPAFAQSIAPLVSLPWEAFWLIWMLIQFAALLLIVGPAWAGVILLLPWPSLPGYANSVPSTIYNGNPQLLIALAIAAGLRWPAAWAVPILTKVTPGIGVLWFAVRREWRRLGIALGATALIVAVSAIFSLDLWRQWIGLLADSADANTLAKEPILPLPLLVRLPVATAVLVWGALTDRYWTVPIAATLALPAIQLGGFAILVAAIPFLGLPLTPRWPLPRRASDESAPAQEPMAPAASRSA